MYNLDEQGRKGEEKWTLCKFNTEIKKLKICHI